MIRAKSLLVVLLSGSMGAAAMPIINAATGTASAAPSVQRLDDEPYPHMRKALDDLKHARESLENAEPRFKGHRDKAIDSVDHAIKECKDALAEG